MTLRGRDRYAAVLIAILALAAGAPVLNPLIVPPLAGRRPAQRKAGEPA